MRDLRSPLDGLRSPFGASRGPTGPTNTVAPVVSGTATVGQTLSTTNGTWSGVGTITYAYQWRDDGVAISGATSSTYTLQAAEEGGFITCTVTATDTNGSTSATSNSVGPVVAAASFDPATLFASGEEGAWYDIDPAYLFQNSGGTGAVTVGDPVGYVTDRSGNGNHLVQATASRRGTLRQTAGGEYYIEFDGVDDRYQVTYGSTITSRTMCLSFRVNSASAVCDDIGGENDNSLYSGSDGSMRYMSTAALITGATGWTWGADLYATTQALSDGTHTLDGSGASASASTSAPTIMNGLTVGSLNTDFFDLDGRLYAMVDVGRALTAGETSDLEGYIKGKAGIA